MVARRCQWGASLSSLQCVPTHSAGACTAMLGHKSRLAGPALIMTEMAPRPTPEHHDSTHSSAVPLANTAPVHRYADCSEPMKHYECRSLPIADLVLARHSCCPPPSPRAHARACAHARALGSVFVPQYRSPRLPFALAVQCSRYSPDGPSGGTCALNARGTLPGLVGEWSLGAAALLSTQRATCVVQQHAAAFCTR